MKITYTERFYSTCRLTPEGWVIDDNGGNPFIERTARVEPKDLFRYYGKPYGFSLMSKEERKSAVTALYDKAKDDRYFRAWFINTRP